MKNAFIPALQCRVSTKMQGIFEVMKNTKDVFHIAAFFIPKTRHLGEYRKTIGFIAELIQLFRKPLVCVSPWIDASGEFCYSKTFITIL